MASYATCTSVSPACPVEATTYGYAPNLAGNIVLLVVFGICTIAQFTLGIKNHIRAFTFAATVGCLGETLGYGGRLIMHQNPWSQTGFQMQIVCLILSPSFLAAGLYLTLKHLVIYYGPQYSKLKPVLYTWIFIGCDAVSIVTQAAGGGIAASHQANLVTIGDYVMVAGICIQVATMAACAVMGVDFALRLHRSRGNVSDEKTFVDEQENSDRGRAPKSLRFFMSCMTLAFVTIFIRSVYRIPEMVGGWGNPLMQDQTEFMILDGTMTAIAAIAMTVAHPGFYFPEISSRYTQRMALDGGGGSDAEQAIPK